MKIGIVGAGPAGLHAALLLQPQHEVDVFEARDRVGGRLLTAASGYEAGGEWIDGDHSRCVNSLRSCGIEPEPAEADYRLFRGGTEYLGPDEVMRAAKERVDVAAQAMSRPLEAYPWDNQRHARLDEESVRDFFGAFCSESDIWWPNAYYRSDEGEDLDRVGLLGWLCGYRNYLDREEGAASFYRVPGGMTSWMEELARGLKHPPALRKVLKGVVQSGEKVWLDFGGEALPYDHVVLSLPPRCLEHVSFDPPLSDEKLMAIHGCQMGRTIKIGLVYNSRWWEAVGWSGYLFCDRPLQQVWPGLPPSPTLCAYIGGDDAMQWVGRENAAEVAADMLETLVPGGREHFVGGQVHDWISDPFCQGGFSHLAQGYVLGPMRHMPLPVGRVHFAGEHTSLWTGFIEGALESAERVAQEIQLWEN